MTDRTRASATTAAVAALVGGALLVTLTACASIENILQKQHEETFDTYAQAEKSWVGVALPAWIPDDATELHNLATTDETQSVIRITTDSPPAGDCAEVDRHALPGLTAEWTAVEFPDTITLCGDYELMPVAGGWQGWFVAQSEGDQPGD